MLRGRGCATITPVNEDEPAQDASLIPWTDPEPAMGTVTAFARRVTDLGLGAASVVAGVTVEAVERFVPGEARPPGSPSAPGLLRLVPGALLGVGIAAQRRVLEITAATERTAAQLGGLAARTPLVGASLRSAEDYLSVWSDRGSVTQARNRALVGEFVRRLTPELASAVVAQLPIEAIVDSIDMDAIIDQVDVDRMIGRVDVDRIISRVSIDDIMKRVDIDAIMNQIDIGPLAAEVITEVDIGAIVRESTSSIGSGALDSLRVTAMTVDVAVAWVVDKVLFRKRPRATEVPGYEIGREEADQ